MRIQLLSKIVNSKNVRDRKITAKLKTALYFLFYFDPTSFHQSRRGFQIERKTKNSLRENLKLVKRLFSKVFLNLQYNSNLNNEKEFLMLKYYLNNLENLKKTQLKTLDIRNEHLTKIIPDSKKSFFSLELSFLDDFLNV